MDVKVQRAWSLNNELKIGGKDLSTWLVFFKFGSPFIFYDNWYRLCCFWTNKATQLLNITRKYNHMFRSIKTQTVWNFKSVSLLKIIQSQSKMQKSTLYTKQQCVVQIEPSEFQIEWLLWILGQTYAYTIYIVCSSFFTRMRWKLLSQFF